MRDDHIAAGLGAFGEDAPRAIIIEFGQQVILPGTFAKLMAAAQLVWIKLRITCLEIRVQYLAPTSVVFFWRRVNVWIGLNKSLIEFDADLDEQCLLLWLIEADPMVLQLQLVPFKVP